MVKAPVNLPKGASSYELKDLKSVSYMFMGQAYVLLFIVVETVVFSTLR
jgi:hypothetical protein